ncbi:MAG TPA: PAAR domain-containing protein [Thermodesulfovibrionales bacterium]|nr:PAAR domain-containing protein [Thermodesulfovibrionales bacterium]
MPPAARVGDMTSHGTPLGPGPGSINVLIGGMQAWRATSDFHACPLINPGPAPHVGGIVSLGSVTVLINNLPATRQGDIITESGPPNSIAIGCPIVQIG